MFIYKLLFYMHSNYFFFIGLFAISWATPAAYGVPAVAQWLTNPTRNHEDSGSVPALAQWVNDLALL